MYFLPTLASSPGAGLANPLKSQAPAPGNPLACGMLYLIRVRRVGQDGLGGVGTGGWGRTGGSVEGGGWGLGGWGGAVRKGWTGRCFFGGSTGVVQWGGAAWGRLLPVFFGARAQERLLSTSHSADIS